MNLTKYACIEELRQFETKLSHLEAKAEKVASSSYQQEQQLPCLPMKFLSFDSAASSMNAQAQAQAQAQMVNAQFKQKQQSFDSHQLETATSMNAQAQAQAQAQMVNAQFKQMQQSFDWKNQQSFDSFWKSL